MKIANNQIEGYLRRLDPSIRAYLLFGPDSGLAAERCQRLMRLVVDDLSDPFLVSDLGGDQLRQEPGRLIEEAQAMSMIGGRRVLRIRQAGDYLTKIIDPLLALPQIEALVVIEGGDLASSSSLRRLFDKSKVAAGIACYRDEGKGIQNLIDAQLRDAGMRIDRDARELLVASLGGDHEMSKREIEKLILVHSDRTEQQITSEEVAQTVGNSAALAIDDWVFAVLLGHLGRAQSTHERLISEGQPAIRLLRVMSMTLKRLLILAMDNAEPSVSINRARPPIHFRQKPLFERTLRRWTARQLADLLSSAQSCEAACKQTGRPHALILAQFATTAKPGNQVV